MSEENRHEAADLDDYSTQEPADSLTGEPGVPGDDPLDRGVAPPERWSSVIRNADEPESLDRRLQCVAGVLETGLFVGLCDTLIVGTDTGVEQIDSLSVLVKSPTCANMRACA